ncbi:hypothetical protein EIN_173170 [Entamoeba invadens IP1]|uniref:Nucleotide-diphospho-sugar transferase domain-containing protein n=2 Tax=Entamoeba invadens TaxID=33085 RepID=A0A0A1TVX9_ENTIV|nr:hypothetical protein EIN_173170 [Entamoeba invadens IP1]ELP84652.1 hypothetical protein EIN_173170 [Entamoeba invadens IP1]BAN42257.1 hypothetical protein [Entamoeba invadens]|eukprot:XP_004183998.1 hypothetical protein EIN_173170 [Entamoeba invadens IP1]
MRLILIFRDFSLVFVLVTVILFYFWPVYQTIEDRSLLTRKVISKFSNTRYDVNNFNYTGDCGKVFRYLSNNNRDVILGSLEYKTLCQGRVFWTAIKMARQAVPKARFVILIQKGYPSYCEGDMNIMRELGVELVFFDKKFQGDMSSLRFFHYLDYLKQHINNIDRVVLMDVRDVFFFGDFFMTFSTNEMSFVRECRSDTDPSLCYGPATFSTHGVWLEKFFGGEVRKQFEEQKLPAVNGGFMFGGVEKVIQMLEIFESFVDKRKMKWGYDQALFNVLYYNGTFNSIGAEASDCTQRFCYLGDSFRTVQKTILMGKSDCSPVATHKLRLNDIGWEMT